MGLEAPVGGTVHTGGGEGGEAQLAGAGGDVLGHGLQGAEILDLVHGVAGLLQQTGVDDDAVALVYVRDTQHGAAVLKGEVIAGQLAVESGAGHVIAVVLPLGQAHGAVDLEQRGGLCLGQLAHEGGLVLAGGGGLDLHLHAGLLGVELGQLLPVAVLLGLEVQIVHRAGAAAVGGSAGAAAAVSAAAGGQRQRHDTAQGQGQESLLHFIFLLFVDITRNIFRKRYW